MVVVSEDNSTQKEISDGADLNNVEEKGIVFFNYDLLFFSFYLIYNKPTTIEPVNNTSIRENNVSTNEDKKSIKEEQSDEVNSPESAKENNIKKDKGNKIVVTL